MPAVDLGKSGCRTVPWSAPEQDAAAEHVIISIRNEIVAGAGHPEVGARCVGAAGALAAPDAVRTLAGWLSARIPTGEAVMCGDALTGHAGALGGHAGLVLPPGTAAVVVGLGSATAKE